MTQYAIIAALALALCGGLYLKGKADGRALCEARVEAAMEASREATAKLEAARLAAQAERDRLNQLLEDAAYAEPVTHPACLPAGRVFRLNQIR